MSFGEARWLFALLVLPLIAGMEVLAAGRDRERTERLVSRGLWARVVKRTPTAWRFTRLALVLVATLALVLALARPQWGIVREKVEREGVDVVLVMDTSQSMATEDVPPSRFFLARNALLNLVGRLGGDRFGLIAFQAEAYPLVPLTLDADAVGLFLDTLEPGAVPAPGSSLGAGIARALQMFVDKDRRNKVMVLVSDGEDLEGEVEEAVRQAKERGVIVHTVLVGTEQGQPVPDVDGSGRRIGFKKDEAGAVVVSRAHPETMETIARGTGGRAFRITGSDTSLSALAAAIEGMEQQTLAREWSYRKKDRYQIPLGVALVSLAAALLLPLPRRRVRGAAQVAAVLVVFALVLPPAPALAQSPEPPPAAEGTPPSPPPAAQAPVVDELLLKPRRLTSEGRKAYAEGNHPDALSAFSRAAGARPGDPAARFNLADGLYKNGHYDEAAAIYSDLAKNAQAPLAGPARYNLGNTRFEKQDYKGAIGAYRDALHVAPDDPDVRRNLELALRALQKQEEQQKKQQQQQDKDKDKDKDQQQQQQQQSKNQDGQSTPQKRPDQDKTPEQKEKERFEQEAGMPRERADQLLDALQQDEKSEQKKQLAQKGQPVKRPKDW